jgi:nucleotide-binding universal stress UspA family protein
MNQESDDVFRIVVGQDLEPNGDEALEESMALAQRVRRAEIHVVHALARPSPRNVDMNDRRMQDAMLELRSRVQLAVDRYPGVVAHAHVRFGSPVGTIIQIAVDYDASLILVGTHARRGLDRVRNRSVAERLVRTAPLPVLVAHAKDFARLPLTVRPDRARPGEDLHAERAISEIVIAPERASHISGLL